MLNRRAQVTRIAGGRHELASSRRSAALAAPYTDHGPTGAVSGSGWSAGAYSAPVPATTSRVQPRSPSSSTSSMELFRLRRLADGFVR